MQGLHIVQAAWPLWLLLWTGWVVQAVLAMLLVRKFLVRRVMPGSPWAFDAYRPRAFVIVPFKGADDDPAAAVSALLAQDYADYRLFCVVESADDPAYPVLQRELARHGAGALIIAGHAPADRGQKVHNLLASIDHIDPLSRDEDVWVFADSDAVPGRYWLGKLVGPLSRERIGVATGYRWLIPRAGASVWADLASVLNSSVACFMGRESFNHAWGGSMAMRVKTAREGDLRQWLDGAVSDDYQVTRMCRHLGLKVGFVPECLVASPVDLSLGQLLNFTHRQHLITRIHTPWLFYGGMGLTGFYTVACLSAWAVFVHEVYYRPAGWGWLTPLSAMVIVLAVNLVRSHYRRRIVGAAFGRETLAGMRRTLRIDRFLTPLWLGLHLALLLRALFGRRIAWRGIRYRIHGPQQVIAQR